MSVNAIARVERDESHWYGVGWRDLRGNLVQLCIQESCRLLDKLCCPKTNDADKNRAVHAFVEDVLSAIQERLEQNPNADRWRHSLRLLAQPSNLCQALDRDKERFAADDGDVDPESLLGRILKSEFERMRRELQTDYHHPQREQHQRRQKTWEQIDRISRSLLDVNDKPDERFSNEHLKAVIADIRCRYPNRHDLPRTLDTLEGYFEDFCEAYQHYQLMYWKKVQPPEIHQMDANDLDILEDLTEMTLDPSPCFQALSEAHAEAFAIKHRLQGDLAELLPAGGSGFTNARAYCVQRGISKRQFYRLVREAAQSLATCLQRQLKENS